MQFRTLLEAVLYKERGKARPDRQLSKLQWQILAWLADREALMLERIDATQELTNRGIPWDIKALSKAQQLESHRANISASLSALVRRNLASARKVGNTTRWVILTPEGRKLITEYRKHGKTQRQIEDELPDPPRLRLHIKRRSDHLLQKKQQLRL
jgi:DNA-binding MarR family transcriptional regulator